MIKRRKKNGFIENLFYGYIILTFLPFIFGHPFTVTSVPWPLIICIGFIVIGLIIRGIKFKFKIKIGPFFTGILLMAIAMSFGGMLNNNISYFKQCVIIIPISLALILVFGYFDCINNVSFENLALILSFLGVFISLQCFAYYVSSPNIVQALFNKNLGVGWGVHNNVAIILLLLIPAPYYLYLNNKNNKAIVFLILTYFLAFTLLLTYSRGAIIALIIELCALFIIGLFKYPQRKKFLVSNFSIIGSFLVVLATVFLFHLDDAKQLFLRMGENIMNLNGRIEIYKAFFLKSQENLLVGHGLVYPIDFPLIVGSHVYQWGHGTIIHTLFALGIFGVVVLFFHLIQKYFYLFKAKNLACTLIAVAFACSGFYGLVDLSYYFINYMIIMLIMMIVAPTGRTNKYA